MDSNPANVRKPLKPTKTTYLVFRVGIICSFRRFSFGNGEELTAEEIDILISAYLYTAQGKQMLSNDIVLVDNIRYGHSREMFEGDREVGVVMAGSIWNRGVRIAGQTDI